MLTKSGKKVGLALGSGSARGFAHIGVIEVLEENKIPIDLVVGCSMGAVIGGIYSAGSDIRMLGHIIPMINEKDFLDVVVPKHGGILKGEKIRDLIKLFTKGLDFSETLIDFACIATDIKNGELVVMNYGQIDDAIRASISIPGIFEPHKWNDRMLVDGGVLARVPIKTTKELGADIVIGVDVGYRGGEVSLEPVNMINYLLATTDIMSWQVVKLTQDDADVMIVPDVGKFDPGSFKNAQECIDAGRVAALEQLPNILKIIGEVDQNEDKKISLKKVPEEESDE